MYTVTFEDDTHFIGGPPSDSKWTDMPNKPIKRLVYKIGTKYLLLEGFEEYNHISEITQVVQNQKSFFSKLILMGKKNRIVYCVILDYKEGVVRKAECPEGSEYNGRPVTGWKKGMLSKSYLIKIK